MSALRPGCDLRFISEPPLAQRHLLLPALSPRGLRRPPHSSGSAQGTKHHHDRCGVPARFQVTPMASPQGPAGVRPGEKPGLGCGAGALLPRSGGLAGGGVSRILWDEHAPATRSLTPGATSLPALSLRPTGRDGGPQTCPQAGAQRGRRLGAPMCAGDTEEPRQVGWREGEDPGEAGAATAAVGTGALGAGSPDAEAERGTGLHLSPLGAGCLLGWEQRPPPSTRVY